MKNIRKLIALFCALLMILTLAAMPASALGLGKTKVGISWQDDPTGAGRATYAQAVIRAGGRPVYLPLVDSTAEAKEAVDSVDAVIMTGGEDINPALYGEAPSQKLETVNKERDTSDTLMLKEAISEDKPTLCICRGCQMLNVVRGGTLYQDLPTELPSDVSHRASGGIGINHHDIVVYGDNLLSDIMGGPGTYDVNSYHHQGIKDVGDGLTIAARAPDTLVEGVVLPGKKYVLGVQFHPELMVLGGHTQYLTFFEKLMAAA